MHLPVEKLKEDITCGFSGNTLPQFLIILPRQRELRGNILGKHYYFVENYNDSRQPQLIQVLLVGYLIYFAYLSETPIQTSQLYTQVTYDFAVAVLNFYVFA